DLVIVDMSFETMFMSVKQKKVDMCIGGITINDARAQYVDFTIPYFQTGQQLVVPADNTEFDEAETAEDVEAILREKDDSQTIGVEGLTTSQYYCEGDEESGYPGFPLAVRHYRDIQAAVDGLVDGEIDYVVGDQATLKRAVDRLKKQE
ncbi:MAG: transporter substrate-binding domain-containing protein, partial [Lachnospiraceae bacterium]|nr:transporter substrate-binding domain-containing protein [Lachnospiraceae bacterium]